MARKPRVLAAFTRHVVPYLEKTVGHYVDVVSVSTVEDALERLREDPSIALVLCGVYFNGSRMFELMRHVKLRPGKSHDTTALTYLIAAAHADMQERVHAEGE